MILFFLLSGAEASAQAESAGEFIRLKLTRPVMVHSPSKVKRFYKSRNYAPAWSGETGALRPGAGSLLSALRDSELEGLRPEYYRLRAMEALVARTKETTPAPVETLSALDIMLTDAFFTYGSDLMSGRVGPEMSKAERASEDADLMKALSEALDGKCSVAEALRGLLPQHPAYGRLRAALFLYRTMAPWPSVPPGPPLARGQRGERVSALRKRLAATGDLGAGGWRRDFFDSSLEEAVVRFQQRHGLEPDGVAGRSTLSAMNVPIEKRIRQIELNMERWRWFPKGLARRFVVVNSADFELVVVEDGFEALRMRVVVGKPYWKTPAFSAKMTYIVLNPSWNIPKKIAQREVLPAIRKDPGYISKQGIEVFKGETPIDPASADLSKDASGLMLVQRPGPLNPLGRVKFMFPNPYAVYLHDTPSKGLFEKTVRTFSHGCIRIERPMELAQLVLRDKPGWDRAKILAEIEKGKETTVTLPEPIEVHIFYWTAWVDERGDLQFREDVYGRDAPLDGAL